MRNRTNQILIRLNDAKFAQYQKRREQAGKSGNAFCLACLLNHPIRTVENLPEILRQLKAIGNNLNQIAKRMNATGNVYKADVKEVKELMKQVWQSQKSMLSRQPSIRQ